MIPDSVNDRLLLGLKGTFGELELSMFRQRSHEALRLKAERGELNTTVAIGYRRGADDRLEQDPDKRIREALSLAFRKFAEIGSVRQLVLWLRQERIDCPIAAVVPRGGASDGACRAIVQCTGCSPTRSMPERMSTVALSPSARGRTQGRHSRYRAPAGRVGSADPQPP